MGFAEQSARGNKQNQHPLKGTQTPLQSLFLCWVHTLSRNQIQGLVGHYSENHSSIIILMLLSHNKRGMAVSSNHSLPQKTKTHIPLYIVIHSLYIN